jgi:hypothetical protein
MRGSLGGYEQAVACARARSARAEGMIHTAPRARQIGSPEEVSSTCPGAREPHDFRPFFRLPGNEFSEFGG